MEKISLSHSKILDSLVDTSDEAQAIRDDHLDEIEYRMKRHGAIIVGRTRYNVTVEMNDDMSKKKRRFGDIDGDGDVDLDDLVSAIKKPIHKLFDFTLDAAEGFFGFVETKAADLKDWVNHIEAAHDARYHSGS